jgi:hypothetical protein
VRDFHGQTGNALQMAIAEQIFLIAAEFLTLPGNSG